MRKIYVPTAGPEDWRAMLADPVKQWRQGFSAVSAAQSWEAADGLPTEVAQILGPDAELLLAIPEHKVPLPGGSRASQCDVFALVSTATGICAVSVEAKVNEPFGPTVGEWLRDPSEGKVTRLTAICEMLGVAFPPPDDLRYQLFHRAAAAIVEASRFQTSSAAMIVQSFSPEHRWYDDFSVFCDYCGVNAERGVPLTVELPDGRRLTLGWATGSPLD
ncbi:hypothetical protein QEZ52_17155 [Aliisedimentitalea scapharcae]|uniref:DUF6946 domain-containing protein n=1 Tax=Aliisedimentitalea scapharcae TaxID=1524259 RepID=A0ABZ2XQD3_9RHOB